MDPLEVAAVETILEAAVKLGPEIFQDIYDAIKAKRPDLTGNVPPTSDEASLLADADKQIAAKFGAAK